MKIEFHGRSFWVVDPVMERTLALAKRAAHTNFPVLITGESGTGKELLARYIHEIGPSRSKPFVAVNCAAIPENLIEAELFGYERGAFTGAVAQRIGKFERAEDGTILLDEISEMPLHLQAKLLRVLQEGEVDRIGGTAPIKVRARVVATSNRDLRVMVRDRLFRQDLFFRLNVICLECAALRGRPKAILSLANSFVTSFAQRAGNRCRALTEAAQEKLVRHDWPGNIRELQNTIGRAVLMGGCDRIDADDLEIVSLDSERIEPGRVSLADIEQRHILAILQSANDNRTKAAQVLGISVRTLQNKLKLYGK